jgi:hypothetical protein
MHTTRHQAPTANDASRPADRSRASAVSALISRVIAAGARTLRRRVVAGLAACAALVGSLPAQAGDPNVTTSVTALPAIVTYSRPADSPPFVTYAAYEVTVTNLSQNTLNNVRLDGVTTVAGSTSTAPFDSAVGLSCATTNATQTAISCAIGQLRGGGGTTSFVVIFRSPPDGTRIDFAWQNFYSEGSNDNGAHVDTNTGTTSTVLGTPTATEVKTYVPPGGGSFYTGFTGVATAADPWTTNVTVPAAAKAEVVETQQPSICSPDLLTCEVSMVTIPGTFEHLIIWLRRDASTIRKGAKIANSAVYYSADGITFDPNPIPKCADVGGGPSTEHPRCIQSQTEFTKKTAPTPEYEGDWQWVILAIINGGYRN